jgi:hypothetical protein
MMTDDRIAALEAKIAAAQAELAEIKSGKAAPPPPPPRDEVRIVQVLDERTDLPNLKEMQRLFSVVRTRVPEEKTHDPDRPFRGFCAAFRYVSNCGRIAAPNGKLGLGYWCDDMKTWLRARNAMTIDVTGASFIAAALASGDVLYVPYNSTLGHVWEVGIVPPGHGGKLASDGWKRVLEGSVLTPSQPTRRFAPTANVRIVAGY